MNSGPGKRRKSRDGRYALILTVLPVAIVIALTVSPTFNALVIELAGSANPKIPLLNVFLVLIAMEVLGLVLEAKMIFNLYRKR